MSEATRNGSGARIGVITFPGTLDDVDAVVDLELETLALANIRYSGEPESGQGADNCLPLGIENLGLGHDIDNDTGHVLLLARCSGAPGNDPPGNRQFTGAYSNPCD